MDRMEIFNLYRKARKDFQIAKNNSDFRNALSTKHRADCLFNSEVKPKTHKPFGGDQEVADKILDKLEAAVDIPMVVLAMVELFVSVIAESTYYSERAVENIGEEAKDETLSVAWKKAKGSGLYADFVRTAKKLFKKFPKTKKIFTSIVEKTSKVMGLIEAPIFAVELLLTPSGLGDGTLTGDESLRQEKYGVEKEIFNAFDRIFGEKFDNKYLELIKGQLVPVLSQ